MVEAEVDVALDRLDMLVGIGGDDEALRSLLDASKVVEEEDRKPEINTVRFGVSNK